MYKVGGGLVGRGAAVSQAGYACGGALSDRTSGRCKAMSGGGEETTHKRAVQGWRWAWECILPGQTKQRAAL